VNAKQELWTLSKEVFLTAAPSRFMRGFLHPFGNFERVDPTVKRNAAQALSILNYYKQDKPLPNELVSDASGGCGGCPCSVSKTSIL
jgi:hypothetical protein